MSPRTHTPFRAGELVSERTARRVRAHPRTVAVPDVTLAPARNAAIIAHRHIPSPAGEAQILRRWSVAALTVLAPRPRVVA